MSRRRLDRELIARGLAPDSEGATQLIREHRVLVDGAPADKSTTLVTAGSNLRVLVPPRFVSRGGEKLAGALEDLGVNPYRRRCLDAGAGSGGFTDCLLQAGASTVVAVDVGYGIIDLGLRNDPRVRLHERTNVRAVGRSSLGAPFDLVVADLSFISLEAVIENLIRCSRLDGELLLLIKPQFEAAPKDVPHGGVVKDRHVWELAIQKIANALWRSGWGAAGLAPSRLPGTEGNREFFIRSNRSAGELSREVLENALATAGGDA